MALSTAVITYALDDQLGEDLVPGSLTLGVRTNIPGETVIDTTGKKVHLGPAGGKLGQGSGQVEVWIPGAGSNPATWQTYFDVTYRAFVSQPQGGYVQQRRTRTFGPFTITGNADLADLVQQQEVPPEYLTQVTQQLDEKVAEAEAAAALAQDISNIDTPDALVKTLVANPASQTAGALAASTAPPVVVAPPATGNVTSDTANLQAALNAVPEGGTLKLASVFGGVFYRINAKLNIPRSMTIQSEGFAALFQGRFAAAGETTTPTKAPYLQGCVIEQTAANTDIAGCTASGAVVNLRNIGFKFANGLGSTGDGLTFMPSVVAGDGHDIGVFFFAWDNIAVWGHDGNHYAYRMLNPLVGTLNNVRSYGGGGFFIENDLGSVNAGNLVVNHSFISVSKAGTAHGVVLKSATTAGEPGMLNLMQWHRLQVTITGAAHDLGTQRPWVENAGAGYPRSITLYDPDFEGLNPSNQPIFGPYTRWEGTGIIDGGNARHAQGVQYGAEAGGKAAYGNGQFVAIGFRALQELTTGEFNVALGREAGKSITTQHGLTAIGSAAARYILGDDNVAVGLEALQGQSNGSAVSSSVAVGTRALREVTTGQLNAAVGHEAGYGVTTGQRNTFFGAAAGWFTDGSTGNAITTESRNTFIGNQAGSAAGNIGSGTAVGADARVGPNAFALGRDAYAPGNGSGAIGRDSNGNPASATNDNEIALGTALHDVKFSNVSTGGGSASLGGNSPASVLSAPYRWIRIRVGDGTLCVVPAWKLA